jgi:hypothetical protein
LKNLQLNHEGTGVAESGIWYLRERPSNKSNSRINLGLSVPGEGFLPAIAAFQVRIAWQARFNSSLIWHDIIQQEDSSVELLSSLTAGEQTKLKPTSIHLITL